MTRTVVSAPSPPARTSTPRGLHVGDLLILIRPYWLAYATAAVCLTAGTLVFLLIPPQVGVLIETVTRFGVSASSASRHPLRPALRIGSLLILQAVLAAIYTYLIAAASERVGNRLRVAFFRNAIARPLASAKPASMGGLASEFSSDIAIIQSGLSDTLVNFLRHSIATIGATAAMFWVDWVMGALVLSAVAVIVGVTLSLIVLVNRAAIRVQEGRASMVSLLVESIANTYVIQAYDRRTYFSSLFEDRLLSVYRNILKNIRLSAIVNPIAITFFSLGLLAILSVGLDRIMAREMTLADLFSFFGYTMLLLASVSQITVNYGNLRLAATLLEKHRGNVSAAALPPLRPKEETEPSGRSASALGVRLEKVDFRYPGARLPVLEGVDLVIPAGRITALVGPSGAGKSTIIGILTGLLRPASGSVLTDAGEREIRRRDLAIVPQNPFLFAGSIADNISFGRDWVTREAIEAAAAAAQIGQFVRELSDGLDHRLDEGGGNLSRGQQQRIALARALAGGPRLLVLDEATASVDIASERAIGRVLLDIRGAVTVLLVTHHGELTKLADEVVAIEGGRTRRVSGDGADGSEPPSPFVAEAFPLLAGGIRGR